VGLVEDSALADALAVFQERLRSGASAASIVREFVTHGSSVVIDDQTYARLREYAGDALQISPNRDVFLVGSAKLGFSIKPRRRYGLFGDDSDVDLAIVSPALYERLWGEARRYSRGGGLWENDSRIHFKNDHANGVIKPYVLPDSDAIPTRRMLFDLESDLQRVGGSPYPVTVAVWHSIETLEEYQTLAVIKCQEALEL
jgi:hypothetical protein